METLQVLVQKPRREEQGTNREMTRDGVGPVELVTHTEDRKYHTR